MPIRKKGPGQYCHTCEHHDVERRKANHDRAVAQAARSAHTTAFAHDPIDLRILPHETLVAKARTILSHVTRTRDYRLFFGKRHEADRTLLSVPVNYRYRLLFRVHPDRIEPLSVVSHETYNHAMRRLYAGSSR